MGETYEITEMYPAYLEIARFQNDKRDEQSFTYALSAPDKCPVCGATRERFKSHPHQGFRPL
ncbi:MAG: rubrerythrin family protein [Chloroflexi bacterium]|nr:rubrerythrin family protein [Chloroflexota bacterium]